jgi:hypothetical protein
LRGVHPKRLLEVLIAVQLIVETDPLHADTFLPFFCRDLDTVHLCDGFTQREDVEPKISIRQKSDHDHNASKGDCANQLNLASLTFEACLMFFGNNLRVGTLFCHNDFP